jgi:hypothetical protein
MCVYSGVGKGGEFAGESGYGGGMLTAQSPQSLIQIGKEKDHE